MTLRIGWFTTGAGPGSQRWALFNDAVHAIRPGRLDAEVAFVFCNRERGEDEGTDRFLDLVESFGIRLLTLSSRRFRRERGGARSRPGEPLPPWRAEYDRAVAELVAAHPFDVGVLAGYMLIFTPQMAGRFPFLNLHPAEPGGPVGTWREVIWQLIEGRAERSGVMVHLATEALDRGPVVAFCTFALRGPAFDSLWADAEARGPDVARAAEGEDLPLFREIRRHGAAREAPLVIATLRALADGRLRVAERRVVGRDRQPLPMGLDLTAEVDALVAGELARSSA
jgi:folate-dependent phosphoribosylglycinamide formyltransferase PurN